MQRPAAGQAVQAATAGGLPRILSLTETTDSSVKCRALCTVPLVVYAKLDAKHRVVGGHQSVCCSPACNCNPPSIKPLQ